MSKEIIFHHKIEFSNMFIEVMREQFPKEELVPQYTNYFLVTGCYDGGGGDLVTQLRIEDPSKIKDMAIKLMEAMSIEENRIKEEEK